MSIPSANHTIETALKSQTSSLSTQLTLKYDRSELQPGKRIQVAHSAAFKFAFITHCSLNLRALDFPWCRSVPLGCDLAPFKDVMANVLTWLASDYRSCITAVFLLKTVFLFVLNLTSSQQLAELLCSIPSQAALSAAQNTVCSICCMVFCISLRLL